MNEHLLKFETEVKNLSDSALMNRLSRVFEYEKKCGDAILLGSKEIKARRLYMTAGYASLFNMLVHYFKLSETMAYQRLAALKLIEAVPEAQTALLKNNVNLSTLAEVQSFINKTEKSNEVKMPTKEKENLVNQIMGKSLKETKALLGDKNPELALPPDREKVLTSELTLLQMKVDAETMVLLSEVKSLLSHQIVDGNFNEVMKYMAQAAIDQIKKKKGLSVKKENQTVNEIEAVKPVKTNSFDKIIADQSSNQPTTELILTSVNSCVNRSRYISAKVKRAVFKRAEGRCENIHASSGKRCDNKYQLEYDHQKPYSQGGSNDIDNIYLKCRTCNTFRTKETHGYWYKSN
jgi:5-methylcytosine-specific restriction endonuclease McrA